MIFFGKRKRKLVQLFSSVGRLHDLLIVVVSSIIARLLEEIERRKTCSRFSIDDLIRQSLTSGLIKCSVSSFLFLKMPFFFSIKTSTSWRTRDVESICHSYRSFSCFERKKRGMICHEKFVHSHQRSEDKFFYSKIIREK